METAEKKFQTKRGSVGGRSTRNPNIRYMRHLSQSKTEFVDEIPNDEMGVNGDIVFYRNKVNFDMVEQYLKREGQWINLSEGRPANDSRKVRRFVKAKAE